MKSFKEMVNATKGPKAKNDRELRRLMNLPIKDWTKEDHAWAKSVGLIPPKD